MSNQIFLDDIAWYQNQYGFGNFVREQLESILKHFAVFVLCNERGDEQ
jgi:hypothetical protein